MKRKIYPNNTDFWTIIDMRLYGRCYTFHPPKSIINLGILWYDIYLKNNVIIFAHNPGFVSTVRTGRKAHTSVNIGQARKINVEYHLYEMFDFDGHPCSVDLNYR